MARAKRKSDEAYNARRRAKRLLARLEHEDTQGMSAAAKAARADYIASVSNVISESYQRKSGTKKSLVEEKQRVSGVSKQLNRLTKDIRMSKTAAERSNLMFARQLNLARRHSPSTLGTHGEQATAVFYAATKPIWQGRDRSKRNEYIMRALGTDSLEAAYKRVLAANTEAFRQRIRFDEGIAENGPLIPGLTDENMDFYNEVDIDPELMGSAVWAAYINYIA